MNKIYLLHETDEDGSKQQILLITTSKRKLKNAILSYIERGEMVFCHDGKENLPIPEQVNAFRVAWKKENNFFINGYLKYGTFDYVEDGKEINFVNGCRYIFESPDCFATNEDGIEIKVKKIEERKFYDTTWRVVVVKNGVGVANAVITRNENETARKLESSIRRIENLTTAAVMSLDEKSKIHYD